MVVPTSTSLAAQVNRNEEASREESSIIKARVCVRSLVHCCVCVCNCCKLRAPFSLAVYTLSPPRVATLLLHVLCIEGERTAVTTFFCVFCLCMVGRFVTWAAARSG